MIVTKKKLCLCLTISFIIIVLLIAFMLYFSQSYKNINYKFNEQQKYYDNRINNYKNTNNNEINNRLNYFDDLIQKQHQEMIGEYNKLKSNNEDNDKICMTQRQFDNITKPKPSVNRKDTIMRDYRVVKDDLFPPFNRSDNNTHTDLTNNIMNRSMYVNTNNVNDTFRLVGYVTSTDSKRDSGNNSWKLFGRQKDRHFSEFYISPTNNNNDVKIFLTDNIIVGDRVRDIYAIPNNITFRSPMLNESPYQVVEIPKQDISYNALNYM